jgi:hypothetical protein
MEVVAMAPCKFVDGAFMVERLMAVAPHKFNSSGRRHRALKRSMVEKGSAVTAVGSLILDSAINQLPNPEEGNQRLVTGGLTRLKRASEGCLKALSREVWVDSAMVAGAVGGSKKRQARKGGRYQKR